MRNKRKIKGGEQSKSFENLFGFHKELIADWIVF